MSADQLLHILIQGSPLEMLGVFIIAGYMQVWVYGWVHKREIERGDRLQATNEKLADALAQLTEIMESAKRR